MLTKKICQDCGAEFVGGPKGRYCKECRGRHLKDAASKPEEQKKIGWRHMFRDNTGTVIRTGGNVISALDDLTVYEEACEAAGIQGPEELGQLLRYLVQEFGSLRKTLAEAQKREREKAKAAGVQEPEKGEKTPVDKRGRRKEGFRFCENCSHFARIEGTGRGICDKHKKMLRPEGRGGPLYLVPGEQREVAARRRACGDFSRTEEPQWIGPSAELMQKEGT